MTVRVIIGDALEKLAELPSGSVHCCVTSPPYYGLRDYGVAGQMGLEATPEAYIAGMIEVFRAVRRVLRDDGTVWLNMGDSYASTTNATGARGGSFASERAQWQGVATRKALPHGAKPKDLLMMPARLALALQADGWWLRSDIIWHKPNPMPESVTDRPTSAHEHVFLLAKNERYYFDAGVVAEMSAYPGDTRYLRPDTRKSVDPMCADNGSRARTGNPTGETRNIRNVWTIATRPYAEAHFATMPAALVEPCINAGSPVGGTVLDPFGGAGTVGLVADRLGRDAVLIELNPAYAAMARQRITGDAPLFAEVS